MAGSRFLKRSLQQSAPSLEVYRGRASGVICEIRALPCAVIPAKAGIYSASHWKCAANGLDSRFRGNDQCFEGSHPKWHHYPGVARPYFFISSSIRRRVTRGTGAWPKRSKL